MNRPPVWMSVHVRDDERNFGLFIPLPLFLFTKVSVVWAEEVKEERNMSDSQKKILEMLAENKITADEADRLLKALAGRDDGADAVSIPEEPRKVSGKYLRIIVTPGDDSSKQDKVNIRVPMSLIRAGIKLTALMPPQAQEKIDSALRDKGINFDTKSIKKEDLEELIEALADMEVNVDGARGAKVRFFVE